MKIHLLSSKFLRAKEPDRYSFKPDYIYSILTVKYDYSKLKIQIFYHFEMRKFLHLFCVFSEKTENKRSI